MSVTSGFVDAILANPEDDSERLIFADWLEEQDDPTLMARGELIRLQCGLDHWVPDLDRRLAWQAREQQLLAQYQEAWLGRLAASCSAVRFVRGLVEVTLTGRRFGARKFVGGFAEQFRQAWVQRVRLEQASSYLDTVAEAPALAETAALDLDGNGVQDEGLRTLLSSPHLGRLTQLDLANNRLTDTAAELLAETPRLPQLTWLDLRNNRLTGKGLNVLLSSSLGKRLRWLDLQGNDLDQPAMTLLNSWRQRQFPAFQPGQPGARLINSVGMEFVLIPAGTYLMGSPDKEPSSDDDEHPQHRVTITRPFYYGVYAVTQEIYQRVTGTNPSGFRLAAGGGPSHPAENITHDEATNFCRLLSKLPEERCHGRVYRLPTEAEWEYAARAGSSSAQPFEFGMALSSRLANFNGSQPYGAAPNGPYLQRTVPVGSYQPNPWGLYDVHGNVWEWCSDWYAEDYYRKSPEEDPPGPDNGERRVLRGGSWLNQGLNCRTAVRDRFSADFRYNDNGLRVVLVVKGAEISR
jgi:uncharacterized protein (TIGR02996 family)